MKKLTIFTLIFSFVTGIAFAYGTKVSNGIVVSYSPAVAASGHSAGKKGSSQVVMKMSGDTYVILATPAVLVIKVGSRNETYVINDKTVVTRDNKTAAITTVKAGQAVTVTYTVDNTGMTASTVALK